jgi:hypothetical protein
LARSYNGDGISFQSPITFRCSAASPWPYGLWSSPRDRRPCYGESRRIHDNGQVGLFLCWRVREGR